MAIQQTSLGGYEWFQLHRQKEEKPLPSTE
jgi:hypothetical protein